MAASDEFPRGWHLENDSEALGVAASITVAGVVGISHVLTAVEWTLSAFNGSTAPLEAFIQAIATTTFSLGYAAVPTTGAGGANVSGGSWAGSLAFPPGIGFTVKFNQAVIGFTREILTIHGYDI